MNKPGIKTTEFWLALLAVILVSMPQAFDSTSPWVKIAGIVGAALVAAGYGISRAVTKSAADTVTIEPMPINYDYIEPTGPKEEGDSHE